MIYITQLISIKSGQESVFHEFERLAIPLIEQYHGRLLMRARPTQDAYVEGPLQPYEIHLIEFDSENDFQNFLQDESRKKFLHLKEASMASSVLIKGSRMG